MTKKQKSRKLKARKQKRRDMRKRRPKALPVGFGGAGLGGIKMSQVILDLAKPRIDDAGGDQEETESAILLTIDAWNLGMLPAGEREENLESLLKSLEETGASREATAEFREDIDFIEDRRQRLYPRIRRMIVGHDIQYLERGRMNLNVISTFDDG
ncbi:MAG: hypothetical protein KY475_04090 [Planctomycetes bacterium]|nr:hypothetical protein [Planctomycetota bacterium]